MNKRGKGKKTPGIHQRMPNEVCNVREFLRKRAVATVSDFRLPHEIAITIMAAADEFIVKKTECWIS